MDIVLRDYQENIIKGARQALGAGCIAPLIVAPTGSGKTHIFSYIAKKAAEKDKNVLIIVHRKEILEQTKKSLYKLGVVSGQIISGRDMTKDNIQVAMVGTVVNRLHKIEKPDLIIVDECHHSPSQTWMKILNNYSTTPRLGFTATPERLDGVGLGDIYDNMILGPSTAELVDRGFLAYPILKTPEKEKIQKYHVKGKDFDKDEQFEHMSKREIVGDVIDHYRKYFDGLPAVCFCVNIEHCLNMEREFSAAGIKAAVVHGKMKKSERDRAIKGLSDGSVEILLSCDVISEGVDIPVLAGTIHLRKTQSLSLWLQQVGRALRIHPGKENAIILDHAGNYYIHGHPLKEQNWSLDSKKRKAKDAEPNIERCPECYSVWPGKPRVCPECNYKFKEVTPEKLEEMIPSVVEGELRDILPGTVDDNEFKSMSNFIVRISKLTPAEKKKAMMAKAFELADRDKIKALAKQVGYKDGWTRWAWKYVNKENTEVVGT